MDNKELSDIDKMLDHFSSENSRGHNNPTENTEELFKNIKRAGYMDFEQLQRKCRGHAKKRVTTIAQYYMTDDLLREDFVKSKINSDTIIIANQLFILKSAEHTIKKLMEEIDAGNYNHKLFEVFAKAQSSITETSINLARLETVCENSYRSILQEYKTLNELKGESKNDPYSILERKIPEKTAKELPVYSRGQKGILNLINKNSAREEIDPPKNDID